MIADQPPVELRSGRANADIGPQPPKTLVMTWTAGSVTEYINLGHTPNTTMPARKGAQAIHSLGSTSWKWWRVSS